MKKVNLYLEAKHIPWKWRETARCPYTTALLQDAAVTAADEASDMVERTREADADVRDQVLLGVAGLAVAAALSMAYQRRDDGLRT
jgi:predicted dienelactone hydrolase